jgi:hypothetical protein
MITSFRSEQPCAIRRAVEALAMEVEVAVDWSAPEPWAVGW